MIWIMYEFNRNKKNPFEHKLAHSKVCWVQKLTTPPLASLASQTECLTHKDITLLNIHTPESWEPPAVWLFVNRNTPHSIRLTLCCKCIFL